MLKILAFDQASQMTGAAWFEDTTLLGYTVINFKKIKDARERMGAMIQEMYKLIQEIKPDVIVFEDVVMQRNAASLIILARLQGALMAYCYEHAIIWVVYKPSEWRRMLHFKQGSRVKREILKAQAKAFVKKYYEVDVNEDEADAICIGCAFACVQNALSMGDEDGGRAIK